MESAAGGSVSGGAEVISVTPAHGDVINFMDTPIAEWRCELDRGALTVYQDLVGKDAPVDFRYQYRIYAPGEWLRVVGE